MPFPFLTALLFATAAVGVGVQVKAGRDQAKASKRAEGLRKRQADLESNRNKRKSIRESLVARSTALSGAVAQGAQGGSGLQGGYAQITQQLGNNILGVNQGSEIGAGIFQANSDVATAQGKAALGSGISSISQMGLSQFGGSGAGNRVGSYITRG